MRTFLLVPVIALASIPLIVSEATSFARRPRPVLAESGVVEIDLAAARKLAPLTEKDWDDPTWLQRVLLWRPHEGIEVVFRCYCHSTGKACELLVTATALEGSHAPTFASSPQTTS